MQQQVDFTTRVINSAIEHWPLVAGIIVGFWWVFPKMLKQSLSNGGGDIIRRIVSEENAKQTVAHADELEKRFEKHERQEDARFTKIEDRVFGRRR
jgi:hypothetical protein